MSSKKKILIIIYIIAIVSILIVLYAVPSVSGALTKTIVLNYGELDVGDEATCYIVRDESVYLSGRTGAINYYVSQNTKVRMGATVLDVIPKVIESENSQYAGIITELGASAVQTATYMAENGGIVSYYVDGYEAYFTPDTMADLEYSDVKNMLIELTNLTREQTMKGEPIYKVCDSEQWYLTCWIDAGEISKYEVGNFVKIVLPESEIQATVTYMQREVDMWQVIFTTNRYYEDFAIARKLDARIITSEYSGIVIPNKSITTEEGVPGVYVKTKSGEFVFRPINIIRSDGIDSLASMSYFYDSEGKKVSTVEVYDEILRDPK